MSQADEWAAKVRAAGRMGTVAGKISGKLGTVLYYRDEKLTQQVMRGERATMTPAQVRALVQVRTVGATLDEGTQRHAGDLATYGVGRKDVTHVEYLDDSEKLDR
jgi:hypothetical protein